MEKITKYAKFYYSKDDEDLINELENYLNMNAEVVYNFFDPTLPRNLVDIKIIPTKKEYDEIVLKRRDDNEIPKWEIGNFYDNVIEYVSFYDYKNTSHAFDPEKYDENLELYKKTIVHEFVHYVSYLYREKYKSDKPLKYLNEGIAQYLSGQRDNIKQILNSSLDDILNSQNCYVGWYLLTKYIIDKYGRDYFFELFNSQEKALCETPRLYAEAKEYYESMNNVIDSDCSKRI